MVHFSSEAALRRLRADPHRSVHQSAQLLRSCGILVPTQRYDQVPFEGGAFDEHQQDLEEQEEPTDLHNHPEGRRGVERTVGFLIQP